MSETKLQYQINSEGQVINIKAYRDTPAYTLKIGPALDELPVPQMGFKTDLWTSLKREVCHLPADGKWRAIPVEPDQFPNERELKRAYNALKQKNNLFMKSILNGNKLEVVSDKMNLRLYVRLVQPDFTFASGIDNASPVEIIK